MVAKKRNDEIINKAKQIIAKENENEKFSKAHNLTVLNDKGNNNSAKDKLDE